MNNGIQCCTWIDDIKDTQLKDLARILEQIVELKIDDIRNIIKNLREEIKDRIRWNTNINPLKDIDISKLL